MSQGAPTGREMYALCAKCLEAYSRCLLVHGAAYHTTIYPWI